MAANHPTADALRRREIEITRVLNAPRHLVYSVWTEAHHVRNWWGPRHFTTPVCEMDVRPGGVWRLVMRGPDDRDFECRFVYREVVPLQRLVFEQDVELDGVRVIRGLTTVILEEQGDKTRLTVRSEANALVDAALNMLQGMEAGWTQTIEKFQEWTAEAAARTISTTRLFQAPRDLVFDMFTSREHVGHFWGPRGFSLTIHQMDARPGGRWSFVMHGPDGRDYPNEIEYREVQRPGRLVLDHISPPKSQIAISLSEESGGTRVLFDMFFDSADVRAEVAAKHRAVEGQQQLMERLAELLRTVQAGS